MNVNVVGVSGSGKSTVALRLAEILGQRYVEMDQLFWLPNWKMPADEDFFAKLGAALAQDGWVLDGNYNRTIHIKWQKVTAVVWLDYSFPRTLIQAFKRAVGRIISGDELWPGSGNRETFRQTFLSRDSVLLWTIQNHRSVARRYEAYAKDPRFVHIRFIRLRNPRETEKFLNDVQVGAEFGQATSTPK